jgi:hypothetical protein
MKEFLLTLECPRDLRQFHQDHFKGKDPSYAIMLDPRYIPNTRLSIRIGLEDDEEAIFLALSIGARVTTP